MLGMRRIGWYGIIGKPLSCFLPRDSGLLLSRLVWVFYPVASCQSATCSWLGLSPLVVFFQLPDFSYGEGFHVPLLQPAEVVGLLCVSFALF